MNLNDYRVLPHHESAIKLVHRVTGETLIVTETVGLDTLLRLALNHDLQPKGIDL